MPFFRERIRLIVILLNYLAESWREICKREIFSAQIFDYYYADIIRIGVDVLLSKLSSITCSSYYLLEVNIFIMRHNFVIEFA